MIVINGIAVTLTMAESISRGDIPKAYKFSSLGYNGDINGTREDIWTAGGDYVFPSAAMQMNIVSDSAADAAAGTGARTVKIHYLNDAFKEKEHTFTMNGITPVAGPTDAYRINHCEVMTAGSGVHAAGNITVTNTAGTVTYARIEANGNVALQAIYTVPSMMEDGTPITHGYITGWDVGSAGAAAAKGITGYCRATADYHGNLTSGIFHFKDITMTSDANSPMNFDFPVKCPSGTDIKISAIGHTTNCIVAGHFEGWLE